MRLWVCFHLDHDICTEFLLETERFLLKKFDVDIAKALVAELMKERRKDSRYEQPVLEKEWLDSKIKFWSQQIAKFNK